MCLPSTLVVVWANSHHTYDVTIWLSQTTGNSNIFKYHEVQDNKSQLYHVFEPSLGELSQLQTSKPGFMRNFSSHY